MFDRYELGGPRNVHVEVTEKRAATDDSARLYGELLDKARREIIETLAPANEVADFAVLKTHDGLRPTIHMAFKLNGKVYQCKAALKITDLAAGRYEFARVVFQRMAEAIAEELVKQDPQQVLGGAR